MTDPLPLNLKTPFDQLCKEELNKLRYGEYPEIAHEEFREQEKGDISWEIEQLAKSFGIYLEFNRAKTGTAKDWRYMVRVSVPGGGLISPRQWLILDELAERYTAGPDTPPSLRLTTRQNFQFHWVDKQGVLDFVKSAAEAGLFTLNGCGDNVRNVMACPFTIDSPHFNANTWAQRTAEHFRLPIEPFIQVFAIDPAYLRTEGEEPGDRFRYAPNLLNRKFKIAFSAVLENEENGRLEPDNCVEVRTNDLGIVPVIEKDRVTAFQIYVGGGQGEKAGKPTMAALGLPLGIVSETELLRALSAVVQVHQEWGDRQNRHWARLKYVIKKQGIPWFRERVEEACAFRLQDPIPDLDEGPRHLHHGWTRQGRTKLHSYGAFIENGRVADTPSNGRIKSMVREIVQRYSIPLMITPNQDLVFRDIPAEARPEFVRELESYGYGSRNGAPYSALRLRSGACVGRDTCRLTYTDSEKFEPHLIDELEKRGWGEVRESIGITGCERQCFRPATKTIGVVGSGLNRYQIKIGGSEDARTQGQALLSEDGSKVYLKAVPRDQVAVVIDALFRFYHALREEGETMGALHVRLGLPKIIQMLQEDPATAELMAKPMRVAPAGPGASAEVVA